MTGVIPVEVVKDGGRFKLRRGGEDYDIKGAGLEFASIEALAAHGGNSFRTWRTDDGVSSAQALLDEAHSLGVTVLMCIEIGRERHGFDYDDDAAVAAQLDDARSEVLKYKDHPALLAWMIGNEVNLQFKNPRVFDAVNDISKMIHEIDGYHPTTTALAGFDAELTGLLQTRAPDLDFVSTQLYGRIVNLSRLIGETGFDRPLMVTEWGPTGHWEVARTRWGAPIEPNSTEKAQDYLKHYRAAIGAKPDEVMGSYVFLWGQKQERTPTWYGVFLKDGAETEAIDVMHYIWTGAWPEKRSPQIESMLLDAKTALQSVTLAAGHQYPASITVSDHNGDTLRYRWELLRESEAPQTGGDAEDVPESLPGLIDDALAADVVLTAPDERGAYRLFVYVYNGAGRAGHANIPFLVR